MRVACFGGSELLDQFPDGGWLGCEVDGRHHVTPPVRSVLPEGCVVLASGLAEIGFCFPEGRVGGELEGAAVNAMFAMG